MVIMVLFMLDQCCTSVVDGGPALNLHWVIVPWSMCGVSVYIQVLSAWLSRHPHPEVNKYHRDEKISLKLTNYI